jgi:tRNA-dihydrouridine synthase B
VKIPVIGNGDIGSAEDAFRRRRETDVSGLMIGRAAMASPWIFSEIRAALETETGRLLPAPSLEERWRLIWEHCSEEILWRRDERMAMRAMRARLMAYTRGMPGGPRLRDRLAHIDSLAELEDLVAAHLNRSAAPYEAAAC